MSFPGTVSKLPKKVNDVGFNAWERRKSKDERVKTSIRIGTWKSYMPKKCNLATNVRKKSLEVMRSF